MTPPRFQFTSSGFLAATFWGAGGLLCCIPLVLAIKLVHSRSIRLALYAAALLVLFGAYRLVTRWYDKREPNSTDNSVPFIDSGSTNASDILEHIAAFKDKSANGMVQARAMYALIKIGGPAVQPLIDALESNNVSTRLMAVNTLGLLGSKAKAAVPALKKKLADPDTNVQARAHDALGTIGE